MIGFTSSTASEPATETGRRLLNLEQRLRLLVLGVVRAVDGAHDELQEPGLGSKIHTLAGHLGLLCLKVGCAVDEVADNGVVVEGGEELLGLDVVSDLGELCNLSVLCSAVGVDLAGARHDSQSGKREKHIGDRGV